MTTRELIKQLRLADPAGVNEVITPCCTDYSHGHPIDEAVNEDTERVFLKSDESTYLARWAEDEYPADDADQEAL